MTGGNDARYAVMRVKHEGRYAVVASKGGAERAEWWELAVAAYPPYAEYQENTDRQIPVFVLEPRLS